MGRYKNVLILILLVVAGFLAYGYIKSRPNPPAGQNEKTRQEPISQNSNNDLEAKTNEYSGLIIEATPINFRFGEQLKFEIKFTTHQGDLNFDLLKQAVLIDDENMTYTPLSWDGGTGGHHLEGMLIFPPIDAETKNVKLIIENIYDIPERIFEWELK